MPRILHNTRHGKGFYNPDQDTYYPGQVSETEALIYTWVNVFFGESEAKNPSWNIHELAMHIDSQRGRIDNCGFLREGTVGYQCCNEEEAKDFDESYKDAIEDLEELNKLNGE